MPSIEIGDDAPMASLLSVPETAEHLRLSLRTVRQLIADGDLRVVRIGQRVLVRPADLTEFVEQRLDQRKVKAA